MRKLQLLIIGAGIAGMSAAQSLKGKNILVHLVEKQSFIGGNAVNLACMATNKCEYCSACLSIEKSDQILKQENIVLHLNTSVKTIQKQKSNYEVCLENNEKFNVAKIIVATGFSPFNPNKINSFHYNDYENVITTIDLNNFLKNKEDSASRQIGKYFKKESKKIAFFQCIGSRNKELGKDYCSQVCCKISMRHIKKLLFLYPDVDITLFHIDLQIIGKQIRDLYYDIASKINMIQGVPAEILRNNNKLNVITLDNKKQSRVLKLFDLIVLSVGIEPSCDNKKLADILNVKSGINEFWDVDKKDFYFAGCVSGPKDILSSIQDGKIAATKVINDLGLDDNKSFINKISVAVLGEKRQAARIADKISLKGYNTYFFGSKNSLEQKKHVNAIEDSKIICLKRQLNNFSIFYEQLIYDDKSKKHIRKKHSLDCNAMIVSLEPAKIFKVPDGKKLLNPILNLDQFVDMLEAVPENCPENTAIVLDYFGHEFKTQARKALNTAIKIKNLGKNIYIIMKKMLVHGTFGQKLYDNARFKEVSFLRYEKKADIEIKDFNNGFLITLKEAGLPLFKMDLHLDCLVFPLVIFPDKNFDNIAKLLKLPLDEQGFLQSSNVSNRLVKSFRKDIFFAGTCHDEIDQNEFENEIEEISASLYSKSNKENEVEVKINESKCVKCLTCFRSCPHNAIIINKTNVPQIVAKLCFECLFCMANCPAKAIETISDFNKNDKIIQNLEKGKKTIFACANSAALALKDSKLDKINLVKISCACQISVELVLKSILKTNADIIIHSCHKEKCESDKGSYAADMIVQKINKILDLKDIKVISKPLSANENIIGY